VGIRLWGEGLPRILLTVHRRRATAAVVMLLGGLLSKRIAAAPQLAPVARAGVGW